MKKVLFLLLAAAFLFSGFTFAVADSCDHEYEPYEYKDCMDEYDEEHHIVYLRCTKCQKTKQEKKLHCFDDIDDDGIDERFCIYCGFEPCEHDLQYDYEEKNDDVHTVTETCSKCEHLKIYDEEHIKNGEGYCVYCGYIACEHEDIDTEYEPIDDEQHMVKLSCNDCEYTYQYEAEHEMDEDTSRCTLCGYHRHDMTSEYTVKDEDTHYVDERCSKCNFVQQREEAHTFNQNGVCERCGYTQCDHEYDEKKTTYEEAGSDGHYVKKVCEKCGFRYRRLVEHTITKKIVKPTCTEEGYTSKSCSICGYEHRSDKVERLYHWYGPWEETDTQEHTAKCVREGCKYSYTRPCEPATFRIGETEYQICPVCGSKSGTLIEEAEMDLVGKSELARGEISVMIVDLNGTEPEPEEELPLLMVVTYEYAGHQERPKGSVRVILPTEVLEGYKLEYLNSGDSLRIMNSKNGTSSFYLSYMPQVEAVELRTEEDECYRILKMVPVAGE